MHLRTYLQFSQIIYVIRYNIYKNTLNIDHGGFLESKRSLVAPPRSLEII
jgi:hypothetical protein